MDVEKVFHMTAGVGETSYARNSSLQKKVSEMMKHITLETIQELYATKTPRSFGIADLGCSSGHNSLFIIRKMIDAIGEASQKVQQPAPEFRVHLNDLPTNDFNTIFIKALPEFYREISKSRNDGSSPSIYVGANPGSFYGRLFPSESLHFIYSSYCLHWLSRVPPALHDEQGRSINKGNIYISETSPPEVSEAYLKQFQEDFSLFLQSRSEELINGGRMVLIFLGRIGANQVDRGNSFLWELLSRTFAVLASKGEIEEEKLNAYNVHFYAPSKEELEHEVRREGSFELDRFEMFETGKDFVGGGMNYGKAVAKTARATQESSIRHLFGEGIDLDCLFENYAKLVDEETAKEEIMPVSFLLVLRKIK